MKRLLTILFLSVFSAWVVNSHAQLVSVKTNVLKDAFCVPNLDLSVTTGKSTALSASLFGSKKVLGNKVDMWGVKPEFRYWISGRTYTGYFVGVSVTGISYDINWKSEIYQGDAIGAGLTFGYDIYLAKHLTLDLHGGFGAFYYRHQSYNESAPLLKDSFREHGITTLPYDIGVSIVYIIK